MSFFQQPDHLPDLISSQMANIPPPPEIMSPQLVKPPALPTPPPQPPPPLPADLHEKPPQIPDVSTGMLVTELEKIMNNENDKVVLANSIMLLYTWSIDCVRGAEICQAVSNSQEIMNRLYYVLISDEFENYKDAICYATGFFTSISMYDQGRAALLGCTNNFHGVGSLIISLQSRYSNAVIFAITAIHNLLLDRRIEIQEMAKEQIKYGLRSIVQLLGQSPIENYEFKVIVLDCLQILAYRNKDNRMVIKESGGPYLLLRTIEENLNNRPNEELIGTASRVLKSLSACADTKKDIIESGGVSILTHCIRLNNQDILKTCLWTLRNLSDVINNITYCRVNQLVERLLEILSEYVNEPCIVVCALGTLANLTCNNESIKQFICEYHGIDILLNTIELYLGDGREFQVEILEPAICALCHLVNLTINPSLAEEAKRNVRNHTSLTHLELFVREMCPRGRIISEDLAKAVRKLFDLISTNNCYM